MKVTIWDINTVSHVFCSRGHSDGLNVDTHLTDIANLFELLFYGVDSGKHLEPTPATGCSTALCVCYWLIDRVTHTTVLDILSVYSESGW